MAMLTDPQKWTPSKPKSALIPLLVPEGCALPKEEMTFSMLPFDGVTGGLPFVYLHGTLHDKTDLFFIPHGQPEIPDFEDVDLRFVRVWDHAQKTEHKSMMLRWRTADDRKIGLVVRLDDSEGLVYAVSCIAIRKPSL